MSKGQLYDYKCTLISSYIFHIQFLKIKIQYRVTAFKSMKGKHCLFKNCAYLSYCHLFYRATQAVWIMIARFHGYSDTVLVKLFEY